MRNDPFGLTNCNIMMIAVAGGFLGGKAQIVIPKNAVEDVNYS